jgi:hypothetical protein
LRKPFLSIRSIRSIVSVVGVGALATAAVAIAATQTSYQQNFRTSRAGTSTGTHLAVTSIDPDNQANKQPAALRELRLTFPKGTGIDLTTAPACGQLDESLFDPCPPNTVVGTGSAEMRTKFSDSSPIEADVTAYNGKKGIWLYVVPQTAAQDPVVLRFDLAGLTLDAKIPQQCVQYDCQANGEAVFTKLVLNTKAFTRSGRAYLRSPATCPAGGWTFKATLKYESPASTKSLSSVQKCKK